MKKTLKYLVIYCLIILLCGAAFVGYSAKSAPKKEAPVPVFVNKSDSIVQKNEADKKKHLTEVLNKAMAKPEPNPVVGIGRGNNYETVTKAAIENAGGLKDIIKEGDVVLIKPNICTVGAAGGPTITDYRTVQAIANLALQYGAAKVVVAEGTISGNAFDSLYLDLNKYGALKGLQLLDLNSCNKEDCYELKPQKSLTGKALFIPKAYMDADVVINVAKLKTHFLSDAVVSLSLKNALGIAPGQVYGIYEKNGIHSLGLIEAIIDLNRIRKPDLAVVEGIVGGEGTGPLYNTPVKSNIIFAGKDLVALDTVALTFMGFKLDQVPHVERAAKEELGIADLNKIKVNGADLNSIKMKFQR